MENEERKLRGEGPRSGNQPESEASHNRRRHGGPHTAPAHPRALPEPAGSNRLPPSRQGKKAVTAYVEPEMHKQLRLLGLELGKSSQEMIIEALEEYFARHGVAGPAGT